MRAYVRVCKTISAKFDNEASRQHKKDGTSWDRIRCPSRSQDSQGHGLRGGTRLLDLGPRGRPPGPDPVIELRQARLRCLSR